VFAHSEYSNSSIRTKKREAEPTADTETNNLNNETNEKSLKNRPFSELFEEFYKNLKRQPFMDSTFKIKKRIRTEFLKNDIQKRKNKKLKKLTDFHLNSAEAKIS